MATNIDPEPGILNDPNLLIWNNALPDPIGAHISHLSSALLVTEKLIYHKSRRLKLFSVCYTQRIIFQHVSLF